jgi:acetyltransferase-like isoleucine patch superfamily enzyme
MMNSIRLLFTDILHQNKTRHRGKNNQLLIANDVRKSMSKINIKINGKNNRIIIGSGTIFANTEIRLDGENNLVEIGHHCKFRSGKIYLRNGHNKHIKIGDKTTVEGAYFLTDEQANIEVGQDCMFSSEIMIRTGDKHSIMDLKSKQRINPAENISIGNRVWVGRGALILKGSELKEESVVGARSIVTTKFEEPNIVVAGSPAKIVKKGIFWDRAFK